MKSLPLAAMALLSAPAARADWQYTKWGMTPEQVVAASAGTVTLLPEKSRPRIPPLVTAASGAFKDGTLTLRTVFSFNIDRNGLACVMYGVASHDDDEALRALMLKRYGPPDSTSGIAFLGMTNLIWKTATDEINTTFAKDDPAFTMQCAKGK